MEKVYKNKNMIRTNHNVPRVIRFRKVDNTLTFIERYEEYFEELLNGYEDEGWWILYFTIKADNWNKIEKEEKHIVRDRSRWNDRKRFWFWKEES